MAFDCSKRVRGILRELAAKAHEREVRKHLERLAEKFDLWKRAKTETWDLMEVMHQFLRGPARRLDQRYNARSILHLNVAGAIVNGLLSAEEVPAEVLGVLEETIAFYKQGVADGTIVIEA